MAHTDGCGSNVCSECSFIRSSTPIVCFQPNTALNMATTITVTTQIRSLRCLLCLGWTPFFFFIHSSPLFVLTFLSLCWIYLAGKKKQKFLPPCLSLRLNRAVRCFCRRGDLHHARSTSCDAPSASQWRHTFQNSTASCPPRAVSSPRTQLCSDHSAHTHTHTHTHPDT